MTNNTDRSQTEEKRRKARKQISDGLHQVAQVQSDLAEFHRIAANHIITGRWGVNEFIKEANRRDSNLAEKLPNISEVHSQREAQLKIANRLHELIQLKEQQAEFNRTAANHIITGKWDIEEFIEEAEKKDPELAEELPDLSQVPNTSSPQ